jgi:hypothetical protein
MIFFDTSYLNILCSSFDSIFQTLLKIMEQNRTLCLSLFILGLGLNVPLVKFMSLHLYISPYFFWDT